MIILLTVIFADFSYASSIEIKGDSLRKIYLNKSEKFKCECVKFQKQAETEWIKISGASNIIVKSNNVKIKSSRLKKSRHVKTRTDKGRRQRKIGINFNFKKDISACFKW